MLRFNNRKAVWAGTFLVIVGFLFASVNTALAQKKASKQQPDSSRQQIVVKPVVMDSATIADSLKRQQIRRVTRHSAYIPGWGQINNRQAWKLPFVYAAVGVPAFLFFQNKTIYNDLRQTYILLNDGDATNDSQIKDEYKPLSPNSVKYYRDQYRRNMDYSVLAFIIGWGLNVVDATVFANLREFDVSDKISMRITPQYNPTLKSSGIGLVLKPTSKPKHSTLISR